MDENFAERQTRQAFECKGTLLQENIAKRNTIVLEVICKLRMQICGLG